MADPGSFKSEIMKPLPHLVILCVALSLLSACGGDSRDEVMEDSLEQMKELNAVLATVEDEASAKIAAEKVRDMQADFAELSERMKAMQDDAEPTATEAEALSEKYREDYTDTLQTLMGHMLRIQADPKLREAMGDALKELNPHRIDPAK